MNFLQSDLYQVNTKIKPEYKIINGEQQEDLTKVVALVHACQLDRLTIQQNFNNRTSILWPPTGYYATVHYQTIFQCDIFDRCIFRGLAIYPIPNRPRYSDEDIKKLQRYINTHIRDADLGPHSWIGIYTNGLGKYFACVVSGLSDDEYSKMHDEMTDRLSNMVTVDEAMKALGVYRELARKRRRFLLSLLVHPPREQPRAAALGLEGQIISWFGHGLIFPFSRIPKKQINLCPQIPQDLLGMDELGQDEFKLLDELDEDYILDDFVPLDETTYIRLAGQSLGNGPVLRGPLNNIIMRTKEIFENQLPAITTDFQDFTTEDLPYEPGATKESEHDDYVPTATYQPFLIRCGMTNDCGITLHDVDNMFVSSCLYHDGYEYA